MHVFYQPPPLPSTFLSRRSLSLITRERVDRIRCTHTTGMDTIYSILLEELVGFAVFVVYFHTSPRPVCGQICILHTPNPFMCKRALKPGKDCIILYAESRVKQIPVDPLLGPLMDDSGPALSVYNIMQSFQIVDCMHTHMDPMRAVVCARAGRICIHT